MFYSRRGDALYLLEAASPYNDPRSGKLNFIYSIVPSVVSINSYFYSSRFNFSNLTYLNIYCDQICLTLHNFHEFTCSFLN